MKKLIALILVCVALLPFAACTSLEKEEKENTPMTVLPTLVVDMDATGVMAENPAPIDGSRVTIGNREYKFPILISELIDDGWFFDENARERLAEMELIGARSTESLSDISLYHDEYADGLRLMLQTVYNEGQEEAELRDCYLSAFGINSTMAVNPDKVNIELPGGITYNSTASQVLAVYGDVDNHPYFDGAKVDTNYADYFGENFSASFTFDDNGRINYLQFYKLVFLE